MASESYLRSQAGPCTGKITLACRIGCGMCFNVMVGRVLNPGRYAYPHLLHIEYFALHGKGNFAVVIKNLEMDR